MRWKEDHQQWKRRRIVCLLVWANSGNKEEHKQWHSNECIFKIDGMRCNEMKGWASGYRQGKDSLTDIAPLDSSNECMSDTDSTNLFLELHGNNRRWNTWWQTRKSVRTMLTRINEFSSSTNTFQNIYNYLVCAMMSIKMKNIFILTSDQFNNK